MLRKLTYKAIALTMLLSACHNQHELPRIKPHTFETDDTIYKNGEILLPDYVHTDTLVVVDAEFLNYAMAYYDAASDLEISEILAAGTKKYQPATK